MGAGRLPARPGRAGTSRRRPGGAYGGVLQRGAWLPVGVVPAAVLGWLTQVNYRNAVRRVHGAAAEPDPHGAGAGVAGSAWKQEGQSCPWRLEVPCDQVRDARVADLAAERVKAAPRADLGESAAVSGGLLAIRAAASSGDAPAWLVAEPSCKLLVVGAVMLL
jgi:hypothetical protein